MVPAFVMKGKEMSLPKVNGRQVMEQEKDLREMEFTDNNPHAANKYAGAAAQGTIDGQGSRSTGDSDSD